MVDPPTDPSSTARWMTAEVQCPEGTKVTGGGWKTDPPQNVEFESAPVNNGWKVSAKVHIDLIPELTVYAQCGKLIEHPTH
ncbi:hypothetical protein BH23THE1_BH23THE1_19830 [soil metagenome]